MKLSTRKVAALKRTAQNNYPLVAKRQKLMEKIESIQNEIDVINAQVDGAETGSKALTGGYTSFDLIERVVESTGKFDASGKELKITKYVPKEGALKFNEETNDYEIVLANEVPSVEAENASELNTMEEI